jgi:uncharacterized membrane protein
MEGKSMHLAVAIFDDEKVAKDAFNSLKHGRRKKELDFQEAAIVKRDDKFRLHIKETGDIQPGKGAAVAGALGAAIGLLAGPPGVIVGGTVGAMIGAAASAADSGIPDNRLENIGDRLMPGKTAVLALVGDDELESVKEHLLNHGAEVVSEDIDPDPPSLGDLGEN